MSSLHDLPARKFDLQQAEQSASAVKGIKLALAVAVLWITSGTNFLAMKTAVNAFPPGVLVGLRLGLACVAMLPMTLHLWRREAPTKRQCGAALVAGIVSFVCGQYAITSGMRFISSGESAILASSSALFLVAFSALATGRMPGHKRWIGATIGFCGVVFLAFASGKSHQPGAFAGGLIVLMGAACWSMASIYQNRADMPKHPVLSATLQMAAACPAVIAGSLVVGDLGGLKWHVLEPKYVVALLYLSVIGSAINTTLFVWVNKVSSPWLANTFTFTSPLIALALGAIFLEERLTALSVVASVVIVAGVALIVFDEQRR